jgi:hypothetical protein
MVSSENGLMVPETAFMASEIGPAIRRKMMIALGIARMTVSMI